MLDLGQGRIVLDNGRRVFNFVAIILNLWNIILEIQRR